METIRCPTCISTTNVLEPGEYYTLDDEIREALDRDERIHAAIHPVKISAFQELGFREHGPWEADLVEQKARHFLAKRDDLSLRAVGGEFLIQYFFYKSIDRAVELGYWREHPSEIEFGKMLLLRTFIPWDVADYLREEMGPQEFVIDPRTQRWTPESVIPVGMWCGDPEVLSP